MECLDDNGEDKAARNVVEVIGTAKNKAVKGEEAAVLRSKHSGHARHLLSHSKTRRFRINRSHRHLGQHGMLAHTVKQAQVEAHWMGNPRGNIMWQ